MSASDGKVTEIIYQVVPPEVEDTLDAWREALRIQSVVLLDSDGGDWLEELKDENPEADVRVLRMEVREGEDFFKYLNSLCDTPSIMTPNGLAARFHALHEELSPEHGYSRTHHWNDLPPDKRKLMVAVSARVLEEMEAVDVD